MGIRFRFGKKVAFLKLSRITGLPKFGNLFWSPTLAKRFGSTHAFRVVGVGGEGDDANVLASWIPTVDVRPVSFRAA